MSAGYRCVHSGLSRVQWDSVGCGKTGWNSVYALTLSTSRHAPHCWPLQVSTPECVFPLSCHFTVLISDLDTVRIYPAWFLWFSFFSPHFLHYSQVSNHDSILLISWLKPFSGLAFLTQCSPPGIRSSLEFGFSFQAHKSQFPILELLPSTQAN